MRRSSRPPTAVRRTTIGVLAIGAVWAAVLVPTLVGARGALETSQADLASARDVEAAAATLRDEQTAAVAKLNDEVVLLERTLGILLSAATRTAAERDAARALLDELIAQVESTNAQLSQTTQLAEHQVLASLNIHRCTQGTSDALDLLSRGSRSAAIDKLRSVGDACRNAQLAVTDGQGDIGFPWDFPDPSVLDAGGRYYAFATNSVGGHVQAITSMDLTNWSWVGEALPSLPSWADPGMTWAPSAMRVGDRYALYFSARLRGSPVKCIGVAFSSEPGGPYSGSPTEPIVCQQEEMGSIDASPFLGPEGKPYLVWKSDGDFHRNGPAKLWSAPLLPDGGALEWFPTELLAADRADEDWTIEGPNMVRIGDQWILLYSSNRWDTAGYRMDFARCDSESGPCHKPANNTILTSSGRVKGPGGGEVFRANDGSLRLAYHAWVDPDIGFPNNRYLHIEPLVVGDDERPVVGR